MSEQELLKAKLEAAVKREMALREYSALTHDEAGTLLNVADWVVTFIEAANALDCLQRDLREYQRLYTKLALHLLGRDAPASQAPQTDLAADVRRVLKEAPLTADELKSLRADMANESAPPVSGVPPFTKTLQGIVNNLRHRARAYRSDGFIPSAEEMEDAAYAITCLHCELRNLGYTNDRIDSAFASWGHGDER